MAADTIAVINTSPDTVELLRRILQQAGFLVVSGYTFDIREGRLDITAFVEQHRPRVIVYDIAPPYEENWRLFNHVRALEVMRPLRFVITSVNVAHVERLLGRDEHVYEVVERPLDLDRIVTAVKEAVRARPTR